ncbi:hypothetical protein HBI56_090110 [Parastagonospora nodorum]|nr:hypothetical protein HBH53_065110 [Parastagonospora nodorum]KAH3999671.1 hypothetical protein HBI10_112350 [Parastagonospora nodorum]KAH4014638.1 hypothetical protein HBI13_168680 [Parastagonospora nodorum]KAH4115977.1 hypothetical protein HBH47_173930 [Parastagonospora nodorum]KAH4211712.1 hypothetical protein HBI95_044100 [Parastagonospora nodorum]
MSSISPPMPDKALLNDVFFPLLETIGATLSKNFEVRAASTEDLLTATSTLTEYITAYCARNMRGSRNPLDPAELAIHVLRTRNPAETTTNNAGKKIKGEKKWYYLILAETEKTGDVRILAEGNLRKDKIDLVEGFMEAVMNEIEKWNDQDDG